MRNFEAILKRVQKVFPDAVQCRMRKPIISYRGVSVEIRPDLGPVPDVDHIIYWSTNVALNLAGKIMSREE